MEKIVENKLREIFKERLLTEVDDRVSYGYDASFGQHLPDLVVQVMSTDEVQKQFYWRMSLKCQFIREVHRPVCQVVLCQFMAEL